MSAHSEETTEEVMSLETFRPQSIEELVEEWADAMKASMGGTLTENRRYDMIDDLKAQMKDRLESFEQSFSPLNAVREMEVAGEQIGSASDHELEGVALLAPPTPIALYALKGVDQKKEETFKQALIQMAQEFLPLLRDITIDMAEKAFNDTLIMVFKFFANKLSDILVEQSMEMTSKTFLPWARDSPELKDDVRFLTLSLLYLLPALITGKSIQKETVEIAKTFSSKSLVVLAKVNQDEASKAKCDINVKNAEKLAHVLVKLLYNLISNVMVGEEAMSSIVVPTVKDVFRLMSEVIPENFCKKPKEEKK